MLHAISYLFIAALYVATLFGLDKKVAVALHAATYSLMGLADYAAHTTNARVGRLIGVLGLIVAFQTVDAGRLAHGDARPPVVMCPAVSAKPTRAA